MATSKCPWDLLRELISGNGRWMGLGQNRFQRIGRPRYDMTLGFEVKESGTYSLLIWKRTPWYRFPFS